MSKLRIIPTQQEVKYKGILISTAKIKKVINAFVSKEYLHPFALNKRFNSETGEIEYRYAWDSLLHQLNQDGILKTIIENILSSEEKE